MLRCFTCGKELVLREAPTRRRCWDCADAQNKIELKAQVQVHAAIRTGQLVRQPCEVCGKTKHIDAHHDDYAKPLDVRWLCRSHHRIHHENIWRARREAGAFISAKGA